MMMRDAALHIRCTWDDFARDTVLLVVLAHDCPAVIRARTVAGPRPRLTSDHVP